MDHGRRMTINLLPFHEDIEVMRSFTLLEITTLISIYATTKLQSSADMQIHDVLPAVWFQRRCRIEQLHARITMPNTIPTQPR
jgi:hypothetical protein